VYILFSEHLDKFYIGYSSNLRERLAFHNNAALYNIWTNRGIPWSFYFSIENLTHRQAVAIEKHLKKMKSRTYLNNLKQYPELTSWLKKKYK